MKAIFPPPRIRFHILKMWAVLTNGKLVWVYHDLSDFDLNFWCMELRVARRPRPCDELDVRNADNEHYTLFDDGVAVRTDMPHNSMCWIAANDTDQVYMMMQNHEVYSKLR